MKFGTSIPLDKGNMFANIEPDRPPNGGVMGPTVPPGAQFWQSVLMADKRFGGSRSFLAGTYRWTTSTPTPKGYLLLPS